MQNLWARILAGEAIHPGSFSKKTLAFIATLEKDEAQYFTDLCRFIVHDGSRPLLAVRQQGVHALDEIYTQNGVTAKSLDILKAIGLARYTTPFLENNIQTYEEMILEIRYFDDHRTFRLPVFMHGKDKYIVRYGSVNLSRLGYELCSIAGSEPVAGFYDYLEVQWVRDGLARAN